MHFFRAAWRHPQYQAGVKDIAGISLGVAAWGLVTGVAMVKSGLSVPLALLMNLVVYAGSAQLACGLGGPGFTSTRHMRQLPAIDSRS